jgi:hypothetical protein
MITNVRRQLGWTLVISSFLLHVLTVYAFARQPDRLAAFTVMPIWVWGGIGLLFSSVAYYFLRAKLSLVLTGIWAVTIFSGADESSVLWNLAKDPPISGHAQPHSGLPVIRVATLNCGFFHYGNPALDLALWDPDIVLVQEVWPNDVKTIADRLYGGRGDYRYHKNNGIITRWKIKREVRNPMFREQQLTVVDPDGREIEVVNVHLATAATDVLDHPLLARELTHLCAEQSRQDVGRAARRKRIDVFHWLGRPGRLGSRLTAEHERSAHNGPERADRFSAGVSPCRTCW